MNARGQQAFSLTLLCAAAAWLAWQDDTTLLVATALGTIESFALDEAGWQVRVDSLAFGQ